MNACSALQALPLYTNIGANVEQSAPSVISSTPSTAAYRMHLFHVKCVKMTQVRPRRNDNGCSSTKLEFTSASKKSFSIGITGIMLRVSRGGKSHFNTSHRLLSVSEEKQEWVWHTQEDSTAERFMRPVCNVACPVHTWLLLKEDWCL